MISWVEQVDNGGCGLACLAMLLDTTYARIVELAPDLCGKCGVNQTEMDHFLAEQGFSVRRLYRDRRFDGVRRTKWPPKPFAERHLVSVWQTRNDIWDHWVVMDAKGNVYDPADPACTKSRLSRYYRVSSVAGVSAS